IVLIHLYIYSLYSFIIISFISKFPYNSETNTVSKPNKKVSQSKKTMNMIVIFFRILILISIALLIYTWIQYFRNPQTHLKIAKQSHALYFLDEPNNRVKNIQFVYIGCLFEGDKYVETTDADYAVVDILSVGTCE